MICGRVFYCGLCLNSNLLLSIYYFIVLVASGVESFSSDDKKLIKHVIILILLFTFQNGQKELLLLIAEFMLKRKEVQERLIYDGNSYIWWALFPIFTINLPDTLMLRASFFFFFSSNSAVQVFLSQCSSMVSFLWVSYPLCLNSLSAMLFMV